MLEPNSDTTNRWVFGYGSLIWNPGFEFLRAEPALLRGAHRSLSIFSHHHRGTPSKPGLVFGLVRGGSCRGMAFAVPDADWGQVQQYLRDREQVTAVYREGFRPVRLASGSSVLALVYLVDQTHEQFAGKLDIGQQLALVRSGQGVSGNNIDYVLNTARHLAQLGIKDAGLMELASLLEASA